MLDLRQIEQDILATGKVESPELYPCGLSLSEIPDYGSIC